MKTLHDSNGIVLLQGDSLEWMRQSTLRFDAIITDPPYGETSLAWDRWPPGWVTLCRSLLKPSGSLWCFGSMRMFLTQVSEFEGWRFVQDLVWEKHNGSSSAADRFRRVHEVACQFIPEGVSWGDVFKEPVTTPDAVARAVRRKKRPAHWGEIGDHSYVSEDGGPRLMRSVIPVRSMHGRAVHPTQKPEAIIEPLLRYSVPKGGLVLDPFAGSGTTLLAARELGLHAVGIEAHEKYARAALDRLALSLPLGGAS